MQNKLLGNCNTARILGSNLYKTMKQNLTSKNDLKKGRKEKGTTNRSISFLSSKITYVSAGQTARFDPI